MCAMYILIIVQAIDSTAQYGFNVVSRNRTNFQSRKACWH